MIRTTAMKICVPREIHDGEKRVAIAPGTVSQFKKMGYQVLVEAGAGVPANFLDNEYESAGAQICDSTETLWADADIVVKVRPPEDHPTLNQHEADLLKEGSTLISFIHPAQNQELLEKLSSQSINVLAMDTIPRISRAQSMDALSSMANIAGYRAMIEAANHFGRFFTGQITAAGKTEPAKVLVIGAGVAGLSAIGTAQMMGATVRAFDTRAEVKEQIQSMGAEFLEVDIEEDGSGSGGYAKVMSKAFIEAEMALFAEQAKEVDIIITTALIPGKKAPELITKAMVESMKEGSVIVDLAAEQGGNCAYTKAGKVLKKNGATIIGFTDLPSRLPGQSSQFYGINILALVKLLGNAESFSVNMEDEVLRGATVIHQGKISWPPPPIEPSPAPPQVEKPKETTPPPKSPKPVETPKPFYKSKGAFILAGALGLGALGSAASAEFLSHFTVFVLSCFVGWLVIWNVKPSLHTPLMSVTNAISGIIIIGGMFHLSGVNSMLGMIAVFIATINIVGGFLVTRRMLAMFRK